MSLSRRLLPSLAAALIGSATAQTAPITEFQQRLDKDEPLAPQQAAPARSSAPARTVRITGFRVEGLEAARARAFEATLSSLLAGQDARAMSAEDLRQAARVITDDYLRRGALAQVRLRGVGPQGVAEFQVTELRMGELRLDLPPQGRISPSLASAYIGALPERGAPLPMDRLEAAVTLLNTQPGIAAAIGVDPGAVPDQADVTVRLRDRPLFTGQLRADNHGLREIGQTRLGATLRWDNPFGQTERAALYLDKTEGSAMVAPSFNIPLGYGGLRLGLDYTWAEFESQRTGAPLGLSGEFRTWRAYGRGPLIRTQDLSLNLELGLQQTRWRDDSLFGELHRRRVEGLTLGLGGQSRTGAVRTRFQAELMRGRADLSGNAADLSQDAASSQVHGDFWRLTGRLTRQQPLAGGDLILKAAGQWTNTNLESSQEFSLGGPDRVRAYPTQEAQGARGYVVTVEWRHPVMETLQGRVYLDSGRIQRYAHPWDGSRNGYGLSGVGLGLGGSGPARLQWQLDWAWQIGSNPYRDTAGADSDGRSDRWRLWASVLHAF